MRADQRQSADAFSKLCLLVMSKPLYSIDLTIPGMTARVADTGKYTAERRKDPRGDATFGMGVAAFAWTQSGEIFVANDRAQEFHHSSFVSGRTVRCAGMIVIEQGIVTALNNNSGHYKPRKEHVLNFVRLLRGNGVISDKAAVEVHLGNKKCWNGTPGEFQRKYASIS